MSNTIFLTGALGFVGKKLHKKLLELGHEVVTDMRYLHVRKYYALIHLASKNNIKNEFDPHLIESNIILTNEIFKVNCRILYASSCVAAYPLNPYAYSKLYAEHLGAIHGNAIGLRFHNIYGENNRKGIVWYLMNQPSGAKITIRGSSQIRDFIYADDVVNEIIKIACPPKGEYSKHGVSGFIRVGYEKGVKDIGTGVGTSTIAAVNLYMKLSGKTFIIDTVEAGGNEPERMVSNNIVPHITLEEGLIKLINNDN